MEGAIRAQREEELMMSYLHRSTVNCRNGSVFFCAQRVCVELYGLKNKKEKKATWLEAPHRKRQSEASCSQAASSVLGFFGLVVTFNPTVIPH